MATRPSYYNLEPIGVKQPSRCWPWLLQSRGTTTIATRAYGAWLQNKETSAQGVSPVYMNHSIPPPSTRRRREREGRMGNQAKKLLNNKKLPKSLAVSSLILHRHLQVAQLAWASEPIEFGSAFVSIYGRASSCALFLTSRNQVNQNLEKWNRQVSGSTLFH